MATLPLLHEYWDRPPAQTTGDIDTSRIYQAVGQALSAWESFEETLALLFAVMAEGATSAAARAFGSIASAAGRSECLKAAAEIFFQKHKVSMEDQDEFGLLLKHYQQGGTRRNEIAHAYTAGFSINGTDHGTFLVPPRYHTRKIDAFRKPGLSSLDGFQLKYRYTSADILFFEGKFRALGQSANRYLALLSVYNPV